MLKSINSKQNLYLKILFSLIICAVATLLISSTILYFNFEKIALEQVYSDNMLNLKQSSRAISFMAEAALKMANQISMDININKLQYYKSPDIYDISTAFTQLDKYRMSVSFIESIYVYNGKNENFYIVSGTRNSTTVVREPIQSLQNFDDPQIVHMLKNYKNYTPYIPIPRSPVFKNIITPNEYQMSYYTFFIYDYLSAGILNNAVIVNYYEDWLHNIIESGDESQGDTFIIDSSGVLVSNTRHFQMMTNLAADKYIQSVLKNPVSSGYFVDKVNGTKSLISYTEPDTFGWRYIRITPLKFIFKKIVTARRTTFIISMLILVVGIFAAYYISRRLYKPIHQILIDLTNLKIAKQASDIAVRQEYLRRIVLGQIKDPGETTTLFESINVNFKTEALFGILLLKIDNYQDYLLKSNSEERNMTRQAVINTACDYCRDLCQVEPLDMSNDCFVLLLNTPRDNQHFNCRTFSEMAKKVQTDIKQNLAISLSITISPVGESAMSISSLYNQVIEASLHRLFYGHGSVILAESIDELKEKDYNYPIDREKVLIEALMTGNITVVKEIYLEIISETSGYSFAVFNLAISHLVFTINNTLKIIQKNNALPDNELLKPLPVILSHMETITEINEYFFSIFENIQCLLEKRKNSKHADLVKLVNEIVNREFADPGLSLESIADRLGITISYICRIYKQYTLKTILDYIVEVRMDQAKEFLSHTKLSVAEIAEKVGFANSSYFYKTFKKVHGVTPNEFRNSMTRNKEAL